MALTLADANRIIGASLAAADAIGVKLSVAVVDGGGHLMSFQRTDGRHPDQWHGGRRQGGGLGDVRPGKRRNRRQLAGDAGDPGQPGRPHRAGPGRDSHLPGRRLGWRHRRQRRHRPRGRRLREEGLGSAVEGAGGLRQTGECRRGWRVASPFA